MGFFVIAPFVQLVGLGVPLVGCIALFKKEQSKVAMSLMLTNIGCFIINCAYLLLLWTNSYDAAFTMLKMLYFGNAVFYFSFILFLVTYMDIGSTRLRTFLLAIWGIIEACLLFVIWTGDPFHLAFDRVTVIDTGILGVNIVNTSPGILYMMRNGVLCLILTAGMIYTTIRMFRVKVKEEKYNLARLCGAQFIVSCATHLAFIVHLPFDPVPICASVSILSIILGVIRGEFFRVTDKGRDWVVEHTENVFVLADSMYGFLDANTYAKETFPSLVGLEKYEKLPEDVLQFFQEGESCVGIGDSHFTKKLAPIEQDGKVIGYSLLLIDVSYQFEMMEQLAEEKQKAEDANQAKSAFMSNMSHEIRTPMNAIVGMTDILLREDMTEQMREYLNNIKSSGNALLTIINDILDFSKIEAGKMEIVEDTYEPMSAFNDMSMIFLNRIGDKDIELLYDIDTNLPRKLYGDSQRIRQVIINLMNNAIKFTDSGYVKLTVRTDEITENEVKITYYIEDSGQGIAEEDLGKLFGNYQQVDVKKNHYKEGTGLGLSISKQLVELMGGTIGVESEYGKGSTFYFTIPQKIESEKKAAEVKANVVEQAVVCGKFHSTHIAEQFARLAKAFELNLISSEEMVDSTRPVTIFFTDDVKLLTPEESMKLEIWKTKTCVLQNPMRQNLSGMPVTLINKPLYSLNFCQAMNGETIVVENEKEVLCFIAPDAKILIVDDHEMNLKVAKGLLAPLQIQIDTATNGKEAIEKVKNHEYHMVFMDHMMPVMDGIEATQAIRKLEGEYYQELPIIALSANATVEAQELFRNNGFFDFVPKPIKLKELCGCIRKWLPLGTVVYDQPTATSVATLGVPDTGSDSGGEELQIDGLDVSEGIANCGSKEMFLSLLGDFYKLIDKKATKVEHLLADGMLRDYTIEVHALKSTSRMIGAMELSKQFYELEQLGNAEEQKILESKTPGVLLLYRSYKSVLAPYGIGNQDKENVPVEIMVHALEQLRDAMENFDLNTADEAMAELEGYVFPETCQSRVEDLSAFVADVAMEDVMRLADELIHEISQ
ncbi:MAG: response regulator [Lachnospiraceae bacterium]|nr:response regulator [Lachnospiraceae bacterium]